MTDSSVEAVARDETGWLVEEDAGGIIHWIALSENAWPRTEIRDRRIGLRPGATVFGRYMSPVKRVKDANEALRFARREDAEAFIKLFDRFLLGAVATEHCWPALPSPERTITANEMRDRLLAGLKREPMREALEAIVQSAPERDIKWAGMTARDIALFALAPPTAQSGDRT